MALSLLYSLLEPPQALAGSILSLFHGSTKSIAAAAGVTIRTAQRWITKATQQRKPSATKLRMLARKVGWQIKARFHNEDSKSVYRDATFDISSLEGREIGDSLAAGNEVRARALVIRMYGLNPKRWSLEDIESVQPA